MTDNQDLPLLPHSVGLLELHTAVPGKKYYTADQMQAYARAAIAQPEQPATKLPPLPKVGPICYASASDVMEYKPSPEVGTHLPGVRDVALWSTHQLQDYAREAIAQPKAKP